MKKSDRTPLVILGQGDFREEITEEQVLAMSPWVALARFSFGLAVIVLMIAVLARII